MPEDGFNKVNRKTKGLALWTEGTRARGSPFRQRAQGQGNKDESKDSEGERKGRSLGVHKKG